MHAWSDRGLLATLAAAAIVLRPAIVRACACESRLDLALPADGAEDVPTNTRIWLDGLSECFREGPPSWRLLDPEDLEVAYSSQCLVAQRFNAVLLTLRPLAELRPETTYLLEHVEDGPVLRFTTGAGPDRTPPAVPVEVEREVQHSRGFGRCDEETHQAVLTLAGEGALFVLDAGGTSELVVPAITGQVVEMASEPRLLLGVSECHGDNFPGGVSRRAATTIRHDAFDLAGNFSGWSEPTPLSLGGCSLAVGPTGAHWWLLLALLGRRRSRGETRGDAGRTRMSRRRARACQFDSRTRDPRSRCSRTLID